MDKATREQSPSRPIGGGFGQQTLSKGCPSVIPPIKRIPVSFEEFIKDPETVEIDTHDNTTT